MNEPAPDRQGFSTDLIILAVIVAMEAEIKGRNELSRIIYPAVQIPGDAWMKLQAEDQKRSDDLNCRLPRAWMILNSGVQQRVEEFIEEIEGPPATRDVTRWSQFSDIRDIKKEMLQGLEAQFENWLSP